MTSTSKRPAARTLLPGEVAWIAGIPCALATLAAIVLLGPKVGHAFLAPNGSSFWPWTGARPEPEEHGRFAVALLGAPLLTSVVLMSIRRPWRLHPLIAHSLVAASQLATLGLVAVCLMAQNNVLLSADFILQSHMSYFTPATLATAAVLSVVSLTLLRLRPLAELMARVLSETSALRVTCLVLAGLFTCDWLLTAINLDSSVGNTNLAVSGHILWTLSEPFAVLNGRTPLVDFHSQYGQLWPYPTAAAMAVLGASLGVYTAVMACISGLALLSIYAILRRVVKHSLLALVLYLPVLATSLFMALGPPENRFGPGNLYIFWPLRYAAPFLLAWLTARHVAGRRPSHTWVLFLVGGLACINNLDFGAAAFAGTLVALVLARPPPSRRATLQLLLQAGIGSLAALGLISALTYSHSGRLPHLELLLEFARLYGLGGWANLPIPELGLHVVVFVTFAAALVTAVVRAAARSGDTLLTSMLAWSGVFGLGTGGYFAGKASPLGLINLFAPWSFALALLLVAGARAFRGRSWRAAALPLLIVTFGFGIAVCSVAQIPAPGAQLARLRHRTTTRAFKQQPAMRLVARTTRPGEHVAIFIALGHRIAYDVGVVDVAAYANIVSMPTQEQVRDTIDELTTAHVHKIYVPQDSTFPDLLARFGRAGYRQFDREAGYIALGDARARSR